MSEVPHIPDIANAESLKYYRFLLFLVYFASESKKSSGLNCIKPDDGFGPDENNGFELANILQSKGSTHGFNNAIFEANGGT